MKPAERLRAAYKTVEDAAPGLVLGNDPTSGLRILAHAALNSLRHASPDMAKTFLDEWTKTVDADLEARAITKIQ